MPCPIKKTNHCHDCGYDEYVATNGNFVGCLPIERAGSGHVVKSPTKGHRCEQPDPFAFAQGDVFMCVCGHRYTLRAEEYCYCTGICKKPEWRDGNSSRPNWV